MEDFGFWPFILGIAIILVVFLIIRGIVVWYLRIDDRIELMQKNNELLGKLVKHFTGESQENERPKNSIFFKEK